MSAIATRAPLGADDVLPTRGSGVTSIVPSPASAIKPKNCDSFPLGSANVTVQILPTNGAMSNATPTRSFSNDRHPAARAQTLSVDVRVQVFEQTLEFGDVAGRHTGE